MPDDYHRVDVWLIVCASPRSFGIGDAWRETEVWREDGKWFHYDKMQRSVKRELVSDYITHWMEIPVPPKVEA